MLYECIQERKRAREKRNVKEEAKDRISWGPSEREKEGENACVSMRKEGTKSRSTNPLFFPDMSSRSSFNRRQRKICIIIPSRSTLKSSNVICKFTVNFKKVWQSWKLKARSKKSWNWQRNRDRKSFVNVCFISILYFFILITSLVSDLAPLSLPFILLFFCQTLISTPYFRSFLSFHRCHSFPRFESFPTVQLLTGTLYIVCESDRLIKHSDKKEAKPAATWKAYICICVYDEVCEGGKQAFRLHDRRHRRHCRLSEPEMMAIATIVDSVEAAGCSRKLIYLLLHT